MTLPQIVAVLEADDRRTAIDSLWQSDAVWAGCVGPLAGNNGYGTAERWRSVIRRQLGD